jgi:hypothetical protein
MLLRKSKILICGSCVSRDAFNPDFPLAEEFEVVDYVARSSLATALSEGRVEGINFDAIESPFQRKMVISDVQHGLREVLRRSEYDVLILDLIDERFDLFVSEKNAICTLSNELVSSGFRAEKEPGVVIKSASEDFFRLWEKGWERLVGELRSTYSLDKLHVNKIFWAESITDGTNFLPSYGDLDVERANAFLARLYSRMREDIADAQFLVFNKNVFQGAPHHRWGKSPFHYVDEYYMTFLSKLSDIVSKFSKDSEEMQSFAMISVDVEALPGRANEDYVNKLIYGKFDGGEYGIGRLCDIFERTGIKATFFVDFACCCVHGDEGIFEAARYLLGRGHDVQLHMHPEIYVRKMRPDVKLEEFPSFETLPYEIAEEVLAYGIDKYEQALGCKPSIFRPGGMRKNDAMYRACYDLGLLAVSATFQGYDAPLWANLRNNPLVKFDFGTVELPLDRALDPLVRWPKFESDLEGTLKLKGVISYLIHSWSLLYRDPTDPRAIFTHRSDVYEKTLCDYLEIVSKQAKFITHSELLALKGRHIVKVDSSFIRKHEKHVERPVSVEATLSESLDLSGLKFSHSPDTSVGDHNDFVSPTIVPVKLVQGQTFRVMTVSNDEGDVQNVPYVVSGTNIHVQVDRVPLPFSIAAELVSDALKFFNPAVRSVIYGRVDISPSEGAISKGRGYILDLPRSIKEYHEEIISPNLLSELQRERRRMKEDEDAYEFLIIKKDSISKQLLRYARQITDDSVSAKGRAVIEPISETWVEAFYPYYKKHGYIVLCRKNGVEIAAALAYAFDRDLYLMSTGFFSEQSRYGIGKHIFFELIEYAVQQKFRRFCLGAGDFGYKSRMGAVERSFYSVTHAR